MRIFNAGKASVLVLTTVFAFVLFLFSGQSVMAVVNSVTPSTNDINRTNGWAHVDQLSQGVGTTDLKFISTRAFASCFEYRTDGNTSQVLAENSGNNYNTLITDGLYPYHCKNNSNSTYTITANAYVEVRMVFGAEADERFDWTRFNVKTDVCNNLEGDQATLPGGMQTNSDHFCSCEEGYHEVNSGGQPVTEDSLNIFTCDPNTPAPTPTPEATPTATPNFTNDGGDGLGCATHDCSGNKVGGGAPQGQVLGASTMAKTGGFEEIFYQSIMGLGATLSAFGVKNFKKASR